MTNKVFDDIGAERQRQDEKWGGPDHDDQHSRGAWTSFISHHNSRADLALIKRDQDAWRRQMVRVAALAVAAIESHDRLTGPIGFGDAQPEEFKGVADAQPEEFKGVVDAYRTAREFLESEDMHMSVEGEVECPECRCINKARWDEVPAASMLNVAFYGDRAVMTKVARQDVGASRGQ